MLEQIKYRTWKDVIASEDPNKNHTITFMCPVGDEIYIATASNLYVIKKSEVSEVKFTN